MSEPSSAAATAPSPASAQWIRSSWVDLLLFIATPLLLVPFILARRDSPQVQEWILYAGTFGALGHHLPGMMRAYGDRALFRRFRVRFVAAPIFLVAVCAWFAIEDLGGVILVTFFWTTWHTLMQVYGFGRIYDSKSGSVDAWTSRLDHLLCLAWFGAPILLSDSRLGSVLDLYYRCGGPTLAASWIGAARDAWTALTVVISAAFLANLVLRWRGGKPPNPAKLLLFASSFSFWWFCQATVDHLLVGVALFDIFHDVQYLALVWLFNRQRAARDPAVGGFTRFLFRPSAALVGLYVGMVAAYGSLGHWSDYVSQETLHRALTGVLTASALLHFYYDGFIWKVRETATRKSLGIREGAPLAERRPVRLTPPALHASKWALFVAPLVLLAFWERANARPESELRSAVADAVPTSAEALTSLGVAVLRDGDVRRAAALHQDALRLKPRHAEAHHNLAAALLAQGRREEAESALREAVAILPKYAEAHEQLANLLVRQGRWDEAEQHHRLAARWDRRDPNPRAGLGAILLARGAADEAVSWLEEALRLDPQHEGALNNLAWLRATAASDELRDPQQALQLARRQHALRATVSAQASDTLAAALAAAGAFEDAVTEAEQALLAARSQGHAALAAAIESRLALYRQGLPYRAPIRESDDATRPH